jgi:hypothetical protein
VTDDLLPLEGRMNAHFDAIYQRFDRLDRVPEHVRILEARLDG